MSTAVTLDVGPVTVVDLDQHVAVEEETTKRGERSTGLAHLYDMTGSGFSVQVADMKFDNGTRDIRMYDRRDTPLFDRLMHGLRLGIYRHTTGVWYMRLRIPAVGKHGRITQHQTSVEDLNERCRFDVHEALVSAGATSLNRLELALGEGGKERNELCVTFDSEYSSVPAVAYAITPLFAYYRLCG